MGKRYPCDKCENEVGDGDIIRTPNGNQYLVRDLPGIGVRQFYIGNADPGLIDLREALEPRPNSMCSVVGRVDING